MLYVLQLLPFGLEIFLSIRLLTLVSFSFRFHGQL